MQKFKKKVASRPPLVAYSKKNTTSMPTHFQHNDYKNKEAPPELNKNKIQQMYIIKETNHLQNKKKAVEHQIGTTLQHASARQRTNMYVISPILPHWYKYD